MPVLQPSRILKLAARISVIIICLNIFFQLSRTVGSGSAASGKDQQTMIGGKRDMAVAAAAAATAVTTVASASSASRPASPARVSTAVARYSGLAAAAVTVKASATTAKPARHRKATTSAPKRGSKAIAPRRVGEEYAERTHSVCWPTTAVPGRRGGSAAGDGKAACLKASKSIRIPKRLAEVIESSGRRAAASLADVDFERSLVFVTGASANHFVESLGLIQNLQLHHPGRTIVYWDIGLTGDQAANVSALCGVTYRKFNFSGLPSHVRVLGTYAFKPLSILQTFNEQSALWWVDTSVRFRTGGNIGLAAAMARDRRGLLTFLGTGHYVFEATHRQTFDYLATDQERLILTRCAMGGSLVAVNTRDLFERVLRWYYWCALDERCLAPIRSSPKCQFSADHRSYANCHRYDQSVLNVLSANMWQFDARKMATRELNFTVQRDAPAAALPPRYCVS